MNGRDRNNGDSNNQRPSRLVGLFLWLRAAVLPVWEFASMWLATRNTRSLLIGLPAGILLLAWPLVGALGLVSPAPKSLDRYVQLARDAYDQEDFEAAELWSRKIISAQPENDAARFLLALSLEGQGEGRRAHTLMRRLAPDGEAGYGPAHLRRAEILLTGQDPSAEQLREAIDELSAAQRASHDFLPGTAYLRGSQMLTDSRVALARLIAQSPTPSPELMGEARLHLEAVLGEQPDHVEANLVIAHVLGRLGADRQAIGHLQRIADEHPDVRTQLAGLYRKLGEPASAHAELAAARDALRELLDRRPEDIDVRLRLANAHAQLGELADAAAVLNKAMPAANEEGDPRLRQAWASLCVASIAVELQRPQPDWERLLGVIDVGLSVADDDPRLYGAIAAVMGRHQDADLVRLRSMLEDALAAGRAPATGHFLLGSLLGTTGEFERGIQHLRTALKEYPDHPFIANNLAMLLLGKSPSQPEEALHFADLAVSAAPSLASVRDTRGQVLFALGRYDEALPDLEKAIAVEQDRALRHQMLAEIYQRRGDARMAEKHRQLAEKFSVE